jgi:acyl-coenzyme A synthetase/AMP-(fatty) acid ligase
MNPFAIASAGMSVISAFGQFRAGQAQQRAAELNAFNIETERERSKAEARMRHNDRLEQYRSNLSANIASFAASGRDIGTDRSVAAFLERQKEIATSDTARSDFMGEAEAAKLTSQAAATRAEGRAAMTAARIGAFTSLANGVYRYNTIKT